MLIDSEKLMRRDGEQIINPTIANDIVEARRIWAMDFPRQQRIYDPAAVAREDDAGSDVSSDLFEIESFSTQAIASLVDEDSNCDRSDWRRQFPPQPAKRCGKGMERLRRGKLWRHRLFIGS